MTMNIRNAKIFVTGGTSGIGRKPNPSEIAHVVLAMLTMNDVGFITQASIWATNP